MTKIKIGDTVKLHNKFYGTTKQIRCEATKITLKNTTYPIYDPNSYWYMYMYNKSTYCTKLTNKRFEYLCFYSANKAKHGQIATYYYYFKINENNNLKVMNMEWNYFLDCMYVDLECIDTGLTFRTNIEEVSQQTINQRTNQ